MFRAEDTENNETYILLPIHISHKSNEVKQNSWRQYLRGTSKYVRFLCLLFDPAAGGICSPPEMSINFYHTTRRHTTEYSNLVANARRISDLKKVI